MKNNDRVGNTVNNVIWSNIMVCVCCLMPFILRTLIIRFWGMDYLGINSLFAAILQVLNITELGIGEAIVVNLYKPVAERNLDQINLLLSLYQRFYQIIALAVLVIGAVLLPCLPLLMSGECPSDINVLVVYFVYVLQVLLGYLIFPYSSAAFTADQKSYLYSRMQSVVWFVSYGSQMIAVCFCRTYYGYIFLLLFQPVLGGVLGRVLVYRHYPQYHTVKIHAGYISREFWTDFLKRISAMALSKVRVAVRGSLDTIIISAFLGIVAAAQYQNYMLVTAVPIMLIAALKNGIVPSLGNSMAMETAEHNLGITRTVYFIIHWAATVCAAFLLCFYQPFMRIWTGEEAMLPETAAALFVVYFYTRALTEVNILVRTTSGVWWEGKWIAIAESVVNLGLNIILVLVMGIEGIILATILSMILINIPFETFYVYKYYFKEKPWRDLLGYLKDSLIAILAVGITYAVTRLYYRGILDTMVIWLILCVVIPNTVLIVCHMKNPRLKEMWNLIKQVAGIRR